MSVKEKEVEAYLKQEVEKINGKCYKWVCLGVAGVCDRICLIRGNVYFVEVKTEGGRLSNIQKSFGQWLVDNGFNYKVIWNKEQVDIFIRMIYEQTCNVRH